MNAGEIISLLSFAILTSINAYWTWQGRRLQNDKDAIKSLQLQLQLKDEAIQEMLRKKNQLKIQVHNLIMENKHLKGQNATYKQFHGHQEP